MESIEHGEEEKVAREDRWEPCPRCESVRVEHENRFVQFLIGITFCFFGLAFFVTANIVLMVIGAIGFGLGLLLLVSIFMGLQLKCKDCNKQWSAPKNA